MSTIVPKFFLVIATWGPGLDYKQQEIEQFGPDSCESAKVHIEASFAAHSTDSAFGYLIQCIRRDVKVEEKK